MRMVFLLLMIMSSHVEKLSCSYDDDPKVLDLGTFLDPRVKAMPYISLQKKETLRDITLLEHL